MAQIYVKVKDSSRWSTITALGGTEFTKKGEPVAVDEIYKEIIEANEFLEVVPEPKAKKSGKTGKEVQDPKDQLEDSAKLEPTGDAEADLKPTKSNKAVKDK